MNNKAIKIKTIGELNKYIGKVLVFEYQNDINPERQVLHMKKISPFKINNATACLPIVKDGFVVKGSYMCSLMPLHIKQPYINYLNEEHDSYRYDVIRTPTKQELDIYYSMLRYNRIFGKELKKGFHNLKHY
jgi:hypothetical protein